MGVRGTEEWDEQEPSGTALGTEAVMGSVASLVLYPCVGPSRKTLCVRPVRAARPVLSSLLFIVSRAARRDRRARTRHVGGHK